jgi:hypothetical protein
LEDPPSPSPAIATEIVLRCAEIGISQELAKVNQSSEVQVLESPDLITRIRATKALVE